MAEKAIPQTISEEEFARWLTPRRVFQILGSQWDDAVIWSTIVGMLYHGELHARAGTLKCVTFDTPDRTFHRALIPKDAWEPAQPVPQSHFWQNGRLDYALGFGHAKREYACFKVRFDPDVIMGLLEDDSEQPQAPLAIAAPDREPQQKDARPNLTTSEAEKFCRVLLQGWPNVTEREAHKRAVGFFAESKVPRDWFWHIFRAIRGPKNPGIQPKTCN